MKKLYILLLSSCLFVWSCKKGGTNETTDLNANAPTKYSSTDFTEAEIAEYAALQYTLFLERLYKSVDNSSLTAYKDEACKEKYSAVDFESGHSAMTMVQIANPESPNDPFDLIDTLIVTHIDADKLKGCWIDKTKNVFAFEVSDTAKAYFKWDDIEKAFTPEQIAFVKGFFGDNGTLTPLSATKTQATDKFKAIAQKLYTWAIQDDSMAVYNNHTLSEPLTRTQVSTKAKVVNMVEIRNPNNLDDETDIIDSTTTIPFSASYIETARIYYAWQTDDNLNTSVRTFAFAPLHNPVVSGYKLPHVPLFFAKATDVIAKISDADKTWFSYFAIALTRNKGSQNTDYGKNTFKSAERW